MSKVIAPASSALSAPSDGAIPPGAYQIKYVPANQSFLKMNQKHAVNPLPGGKGHRIVAFDMPIVAATKATSAIPSTPPPLPRPPSLRQRQVADQESRKLTDLLKSNGSESRKLVASASLAVSSEPPSSSTISERSLVDTLKPSDLSSKSSGTHDHETSLKSKNTLVSASDVRIDFHNWPSRKTLSTPKRRDEKINYEDGILYGHNAAAALKEAKRMMNDPSNPYSNPYPPSMEDGEKSGSYHHSCIRTILSSAENGGMSPPPGSQSMVTHPFQLSPWGAPWGMGEEWAFQGEHGINRESNSFRKKYPPIHQHKTPLSEQATKLLMEPTPIAVKISLAGNDSSSGNGVNPSHIPSIALPQYSTSSIERELIRLIKDIAVFQPKAMRDIAQCISRIYTVRKPDVKSVDFLSDKKLSEYIMPPCDKGMRELWTSWCLVRENEASSPSTAAYTVGAIRNKRVGTPSMSASIFTIPENQQPISFSNLRRAAARRPGSQQQSHYTPASTIKPPISISVSCETMGDFLGTWDDGCPGLADLIHAPPPPQLSTAKESSARVFESPAVSMYKDMPMERDERDTLNAPGDGYSIGYGTSIEIDPSTKPPQNKEKWRRRAVVLPFRPKPRHTVFVKAEVAAKFGGLGYDKSNEEYLSKLNELKVEKVNKQKQYADHIRNISMMTMCQKTSSGGSPNQVEQELVNGSHSSIRLPHIASKVHVNPVISAQEEAKEKRDRMNNYGAKIKRISRPTTASSPSNSSSAASRLDIASRKLPEINSHSPTSQNRRLAAGSGHSFFSNVKASLDKNPTLSLLQAEHERGKKAVESLASL